MQREIIAKTETEAPYEQLRSLEDVSTRRLDSTEAHTSQSGRLHAFAEVTENDGGKKLTLVHRQNTEEGPLEEVIVRVQGYLVEAKLPPVRQME